MRRKIASVMLSVAVVVGALLGTASAAQAAVAMDSGQMALACQHAQGNWGWRASVMYPSQGGWGWRCYLPGNPGAGNPGVDIEGWCQYAYGLHARGGSTAYNWRCDV